MQATGSASSLAELKLQLQPTASAEQPRISGVKLARYPGYEDVFLESAGSTLAHTAAAKFPCLLKGPGRQPDQPGRFPITRREVEWREFPAGLIRAELPNAWWAR